MPAESSLAQVVDEVRVGGARQRSLFVVRLEGRDDLVGLVDEIEDEGGVLARRGPVEPGQSLYGGDSRQPLVDIHRDEQRLVEATDILEFLGIRVTSAASRGASRPMGTQRILCKESFAV